MLLDKTTERILTIILYISTLFGLYYIFVNNPENIIKLSILSSLLVISVSIRHIVIYGIDKFFYVGKFLILIDIAIVYFIAKIDRSGVSQLFLMIVSADAIIAYDMPFSSLIAVICVFLNGYCIYVNGKYTSIGSFLPSLLSSCLSFAFVFGVMYISRHQINQREKLINTTKELEIKTKQLEEAYQKLSDTSEAIEEVTILEERNRIAREIHDTVGHTLTTVLVEIEAGKRLIKKDPELSAQKLELAQEQVRNGLNNIRKSVKTLDKGDSIMDFLPSIESLIAEVQKHADVKINSTISGLPKLEPDIEKTLYRALLEGITNGIKHGKSSRFDFSLSYEYNCIVFVLKDYGIGCKDIIPGFGLSSMKERIEKVKGYLFVSSGADRGFTIKIKIPYQEAVNEQDTNTNSR